MTEPQPGMATASQMARKHWIAVSLVAVAAVAVGTWMRLKWFRLPPPEAPVPAPAGEDPRAVVIPRWVDPAQAPHHCRFRYVLEDPAAVQDLRAQENLDGVVAGLTSDLDKARAVGRWARAQFEPGKPDPYPPLAAGATLAAIRSGKTRGFCAQFCAVTVQGLASLGVAARHVSLNGHEVIEFFDRAQTRWVLLDPQFGFTFRDKDGRLLGIFDLRFRTAADPALLGTEIQLEGGDPASPGLEKYRHFITGAGVWTHNAWTSQSLNYEDIPRYKVHIAGSAPSPDATWSPWRIDFEPDLDFDAYARAADAARARWLKEHPLQK